MDRKYRLHQKQTLNTLETALRKIEFPGENGLAILERLKEAEFTLHVMQRLEALEQRRKVRKTIYWTVFLLFNLALILLSGSDNAVLRELFSFERIFSIIFSVVLGIIIFATTVGLIVTMDTSWLKRFTHQDEHEVERKKDHIL
jgi:hypothetical protein